MSLRSLSDDRFGGAAKVRDRREERRDRIESISRTPETCSKVNASELATATVLSAMQACGLSGYRNDGEFSVSRHLRDVLSSSVMIKNYRILASSASGALLVEVPSLLRD